MTSYNLQYNICITPRQPPLFVYTVYPLDSYTAFLLTTCFEQFYGIPCACVDSGRALLLHRKRPAYDKPERAATKSRRREHTKTMAYGDPSDFGWCNLVVKFLLFVTNVIVWVSYAAYSSRPSESTAFPLLTSCWAWPSSVQESTC